MKIIRNTKDIRIDEPTAVALGAFDGLHLGHMAVINSALASGFAPAVFTFSEDPSKLLSGGTEYLLTEEDKEELLVESGIKYFAAPPFETVKDMEPEDFFREILLKSMNAKFISCGEDFRFGKKASGDAALLKKLCAENGVELSVAGAVSFEGASISSTRIRNALKAGDAEAAEKMLGRPFSFKLPVITGNRIGRTMGSPTINQLLPEGFVKPKFGVYASLVKAEHQSYWGVTNVGVKPTIGSYAPLSETWIAGFSGDLYGKKVRLCLIAFIRPEKKFPGLTELKAEIEKNRGQAELIALPRLKNGRAL